jgi:hypothetical protein
VRSDENETTVTGIYVAGCGGMLGVAFHEEFPERAEVVPRSLCESPSTLVPAWLTTGQLNASSARLALAGARQRHGRGRDVDTQAGVD